MCRSRKGIDKLNLNCTQQDLFQAMEEGIEAAKDSDHDKIKVGVSLISERHQHVDPVTNKIPECFNTKDTSSQSTDKDTTKTKNSPQKHTDGNGLTNHGEMLMLTSVRPDQKDVLCVTVPCCPNCAKKIIIHGTYAVAIDCNIADDGTITPKAFEDPYIRDRLESGWKISLELFKAAGIHIIAVDRDRKKTALINQGMRVKNRNDPPDPEARPELEQIDFHAKLTKRQKGDSITHSSAKSSQIKEDKRKRRRNKKKPYKDAGFINIRKDFSEAARNKLLRLAKMKDYKKIIRNLSEDNAPTALLHTKDPKEKDNRLLLAAKETRPPGLTDEKFEELKKLCEGTRYSVTICPITRLMIDARKRGIPMEGAKITANYMPNPGRLVDLAKCGIKKLTIPRKEYRRALRDEKLRPVIEAIQECGAFEIEYENNRDLLSKKLTTSITPQENTIESSCDCC